MPTVKTLKRDHCDCRNDDVDKGSRQQPLPTEIHQLIVTKARQRPAQPEIEIQQHAGLRQKHHQANDDISVVKTLRLSQAIDERKIPATEIERSRHRRYDYHGRVLSHEKERPAKT